MMALRNDFEVWEQRSAGLSAFTLKDASTALRGVLMPRVTPPRKELTVPKSVFFAV